MSEQGCPDGMYPMDATHQREEFESFADLRVAAERASDSLNFPIGWYIYDDQHEDWGDLLDEGVTEDTPKFEMTFLMPRKWGQTWGMQTATFDRAEVQAWLNSFVRAEVMRWYGWTDATDEASA